ncbi:MAG: hypothetical protein ACXAES_18745, partial [Promethearchaeota archaeon]
MISLDFEESRRLMTKGQEIAEEYGLKLLARKISNEHDKLLNQLNLWDNIKESDAPLTKRMELSRLNDQMEGMIRKRAIENPDVSEETPVLLLIVSEGGVPHFSQSFAVDQVVED